VGSRSSKVIEIGTCEKLIFSTNYDTQYVFLYLQLFTRDNQLLAPKTRVFAVASEGTVTMEVSL